MHELKTGLYADKCATFWMFPEGFYRSFVWQIALIHSTMSQTQVELRDFEKRKNVNLGKTQC